MFLALPRRFLVALAVALARAFDIAGSYLTLGFAPDLKHHVTLLYAGAGAVAAHDLLTCQIS
jgi:hypothetical protein